MNEYRHAWTTAEVKRLYPFAYELKGGNRMKLYGSPILILFVLLISMLGDSLLAGTTGKVSGLIKDGSSGEALIGVNVIVEGATLGAASDLSGRFIILNISPGVFKIRARMIGYKDVLVENVRVTVDQTTTINFSMEQIVLESGETVTIVAERPLVQMDMTSAMASVSADDIQNLPVETITDVLEMQAGIVREGNELHIRGGRTGEIAFWIDGVATTDFFNGGMGISVENAAIEQLQVISGTFNAEYGQAMSGIVNIITKEGGSVYSGNVKGYVGDYMSSGDDFQVLQRVDVIADDKGQPQSLGAEENPLGKFNPVYNLEAALSGPIPFLNNSLTFFANGRYFYNEGYLYGKRWFTPQGNAGDSTLVAMNPEDRQTFQGKLSWKVNSNAKLNYSAFFNRWESERSYQHSFRYNPDGLPQFNGSSVSHILTWNHVLSAQTFYEVRLNRFSNDYQSYVYENPYAVPSYLVRVPANEELGILAHSLDPSTAEGKAELDWLRTQRALFEYYPDPAGPIGYVHPDSNAVPTAYSFQNAGMDMSHMKRKAAYWVAKFDLTTQMTNIHQVKVGAEMRLHELELHGFTILPKISSLSNEPITPFEPDIPTIGNVFRDDYQRKPREMSFYAQDKIELRDLIVNIGFRFDYFDANSSVPTDMADPNIYYPFKNEHRYKNWVEPPPGLSQEERSQYLSQFIEYTPEERREIMQSEVDAKMALSPRLGLAYPITDRGVIHLSYGHFFQVPNFEFLYANPDFKLSPGGGFEIFGNPGLNPQRTVQYEIGLQQQLTENVGIDITLFYKDIRDLVQTSPLISTPIPNVKYSMYENRDYANVRGITLSLKKRYSNRFSAWIDYSFQKAEGTYSNPNDAFIASIALQEPRLAMIPLDWDQNHTLNGRLIYQYDTWTISLVGQYWTGKPYTPSFP
ncbi:MAG: TonB-dependent receptor, partial [Calditrichaeota bacterium]